MFLTGFLLLVLALAFFGCANEEFSGTTVPNAKPDTRLVAIPANLLEAGFIVRFEWTGSDADGEVKGFQWKMTDNGRDGISLRDSLTVCPVTGDTINPWYYTTATDTTFLVSAALDSFPADVGVIPDPDDPTNAPDYRSFQTHTLFVRTVDADGAVDDTPAMVSFTATTLAPTIDVDRPALDRSQSFHNVPATVRLGYSGDDPDFEDGMRNPAKVRWLLKRSLDSDGEDVDTIYRYNQCFEEVLPWDDPAWTDWQTYDPTRDNRVAEFFNVSAGEMVEGRWQAHYWLFAVQAMDTTGAVSVDRRLGYNVFILKVSSLQKPYLTYREQLLGGNAVAGEYCPARYEIAQTQSVEYRWNATVSHYFGVISGYRYGWDVVDFDDDLDPGWQVGIGNADVNKRTPEKLFTPGDHTLVIEAHDTAGQFTRAVLYFDVVLVTNPPPSDLLVVDDCPDEGSNAWMNATGSIPYDEDTYRDAFWEGVLRSDNGGPVNFLWSNHSMNLETEVIKYSDIVSFKNLIWFSKESSGSVLVGEFRPGTNGVAPFNWLVPYMESVGDVLLVGASILHQTIEPVNWCEPIVYNTAERNDPDSGFRVGFGVYTLPGDDSTEYLMGPERFGAKAWGLNIMDMLSPKYRIYGATRYTGESSRRRACVGLKALEWDENFRADNLFEVPVGFPLGRISTEELIDWQDGDVDEVLELSGTYYWGRDEFYDRNITERAVNDAPVMVPVPGSSEVIAAVEPMFTGVSRYAFADELAESLGDPDWPLSEFELVALETACGPESLTPDLGMRTEGVTVGLVSHKANPTGPGSVLWGFDPYRFDHDDMTQIIQWVLKDHFRLP